MCRILITAGYGDLIDTQIRVFQQILCHANARCDQIVDITYAEIFFVELLDVAFADIQPFCKFTEIPVKFGSFVRFTPEFFQFTYSCEALLLWLIFAESVPQNRNTFLTILKTAEVPLGCSIYSG